MHFTHAIVRLPSSSMIYGISQRDLGIPNYQLAITQHKKYVEALEKCGLEVEILPSKPDLPDACFIEDVAICFPGFAVITRPGALSRRAEVSGMNAILKKYFNHIYHIKAPATLEGGDIMIADKTVYIGISSRTNSAGAKQLQEILHKKGYKSVFVTLHEMLHLKTGLSYLENQHLLISGEFVINPIFDAYNKIIPAPEEKYAANSVWINDYVLVPSGHELLTNKLNAHNYQITALDMSEFKKLDGGLSCLSLRFTLS